MLKQGYEDVENGEDAETFVQGRVLIKNMSMMAFILLFISYSFVAFVYLLTNIYYAINAWLISSLCSISFIQFCNSFCFRVVHVKLQKRTEVVFMDYVKVVVCIISLFNFACFVCQCILLHRIFFKVSYGIDNVLRIKSSK